jgi:hypothetical protein
MQEGKEEKIYPVKFCKVIQYFAPHVNFSLDSIVNMWDAIRLIGIPWILIRLSSWRLEQIRQKHVQKVIGIEYRGPPERAGRCSK